MNGRRADVDGMAGECKLSTFDNRFGLSKEEMFQRLERSERATRSGTSKLLDQRRNKYAASTTGIIRRRASPIVPWINGKATVLEGSAVSVGRWRTRTTRDARDA